MMFPRVRNSSYPYWGLKISGSSFCQWRLFDLSFHLKTASDKARIKQSQGLPVLNNRGLPNAARKASNNVTSNKRILHSSNNTTRLLQLKYLHQTRNENATVTDLWHYWKYPRRLEAS